MMLAENLCGTMALEYLLAAADSATALQHQVDYLLRNVLTYHKIAVGVDRDSIGLPECFVQMQTADLSETRCQGFASQTRLLAMVQSTK